MVNLNKNIILAQPNFSKRFKNGRKNRNIENSYLFILVRKMEVTS